MLPSRLPLAALMCAFVALLLPTAATAESAGTPPGAGAVGGYLDLGAAHGCAVQKDRTVRCWGAGSSGRLGSGALDDRLSAGGTEAAAFSPGTVAAVATGDLHTCALLTSGAVRCWGQGASGQLGGGRRDNRRDGWADPASGTDDPTTVPLGGPATALTAGAEFTCALLADGAVRCWGDGQSGALGSRGTDNRLDGLLDGPSDDASIVPLGEAATAVSAGAQHACALVVSGAVRCWGLGTNGRLGTGTGDSRNAATAEDSRLDGLTNPATGTDEASTVPLDGAATAISAGAGHTCALMAASGAVRCWGLGTSGQLGIGRTSDSRLDGYVISATDVASTVPLKPIGTPANKLVTTPSIPAIAISAGDRHTCAVLEQGDVRCWGLGTSGQLGHGATDGRLDSSSGLNVIADVASRVGGGAGGTDAGLSAPAISVTAGTRATCAELATGAVRCWGDGADGRLGSRATDLRLDGVVDPATGTDDASLLPIGLLPFTAGDLTPDPVIAAAQAQAEVAATQAAPPAAAVTGTTTAPPARPLAFSVKFKKRVATIAALVAPKKTGTCPKRVTAVVREGKARLGKASLKTKKKGAHCRAAGTVKLSRAPKKGRALSVAVSGKGITSRTLTPATL